MGKRAAQKQIEVTVEERVVFSDAERTVREWTVTTSTGYRAVLPECPCGLVEVIGLVYRVNEHGIADPTLGVERVHTVQKVNCTCSSDACRSNYAKARREHLCHGWHEPRVEQLVERLYGQKKGWKVAAPGVPMTHYHESYFVPLKEEIAA